MFLKCYSDSFTWVCQTENMQVVAECNIRWEQRTPAVLLHNVNVIVYPVKLSPMCNYTLIHITALCVPLRGLFHATIYNTQLRCETSQWWAEVQVPITSRIFTSPLSPRPALGPTLPPTKSVPRALSLAVKGLGMKLATDLQLVPKSREHESICLHGVVFN